MSKFFETENYIVEPDFILNEIWHWVFNDKLDEVFQALDGYYLELDLQDRAFEFPKILKVLMKDDPINWYFDTRVETEAELNKNKKETLKMKDAQEKIKSHILIQLENIESELQGTDKEVFKKIVKRLIGNEAKTKEYATSFQQLLLVLSLAEIGAIDLDKWGISKAKQSELLYRLFNRSQSNTYSNFKARSFHNIWPENDLETVRDFFKDAGVDEGVELLKKKIQQLPKTRNKK